MIDFEVGWGENNSLWCIDTQGKCFRDIVVDSYKLHLKASYLYEVNIRIDDLVFESIDGFFLLQCFFDQTKCQWRRIDGWYKIQLW